MKKIIFLLILILTLSGCNVNKEETSPTGENSNTITASEIPLKYVVEKVRLSHGYQSIKPNIEFLDKSNKNSILISLGLIECSNINIDKVTLFNNEINIYVSKIVDSNSSIVVPQAVITLNEANNINLKDKKINIIGVNYEPINIRYNVNQILNNIYAQYKITPSTNPHITLIKEQDNYFWNVELHNVFLKSQYGNPLIKLNAKVNADTGEIHDVNQETISDFIDTGVILHIANNHLYYKQKITNENNYFDSLFLYNGKESRKLYTTHNSIYSVKSNNKYNKIALIEHNEKVTDIFLIDIKDETVQKITPPQATHIWNIDWQDNKLYFVNNDEHGKSTVYVYDLLNKEVKELFAVNISIRFFDVIGDSFVFNEFIENENNTNIYISKLGTNLEKIDTGFYCSFINKDKIVYLKKVPEKNINTLWIYDLKSGVKSSPSSSDVVDYQVFNDNTIIITERNDYAPEFSIYKYDVINDNIVKISETISKKVFYESDKHYYINANPSSNDNKIENIYRINTEKISLE